MKAMESLLALSVLAVVGTGVANAATVATYDVAVTELEFIYHFPEITDTSGEIITPAHDGDVLNHPLSYGISGSAVLDDSGTLTITSSYREATVFGTDATLGNIVTVHGAWDGTTFTAANASQRYTSCMDNGNDPAFSACVSASLQLNFEYPVTSIVGSANALNGGFTTTLSSVTSNRHYQYVLSNGTPAVPVPAAAWLFGSGLLGLVGTARRRAAD